MQNNFLSKNTSFLYSLLICIFAIDIFFFYVNFNDESLLYFGTFTHLVLLLFLNIIWAERNEKQMIYYLYIVCNYLLIIGKYLHPKGIDSYLWDIYSSVIYIIPLFISYYVSHNMKQLVILNVNSMMVVGACQKGELLHFWGMNDPEGIGLVSFFTASILIISVIISIILLQIKNYKLRK